MLRNNLWIFSTFIYIGRKELIHSLLSSLRCIWSIQSLRFHGHVVCFHRFISSSHHHCPHAGVCPVLYFCHITGTAGSEDMDVKNFKNTRQLLLSISVLTLLKAQERSHARNAAMLRHLSLYGNLIINPCLIAPSDSVCLTNSEKTQAISGSHLLSTIYFNLSLIWHAMPTLC